MNKKNINIFGLTKFFKKRITEPKTIVISLRAEPLQQFYKNGLSNIKPGGSIKYFYMEGELTPGSSSDPINRQFYTVFLSEMAEINIYKVAREYANAVQKTLENLVPLIFEEIPLTLPSPPMGERELFPLTPAIYPNGGEEARVEQGTFNYKNIFCFELQLYLPKEIKLYYQLIRDNVINPGCEILLVKSTLDKALFQRFVAEHGTKLKPEKISNYKTIKSLHKIVDALDSDSPTNFISQGHPQGVPLPASILVGAPLVGALTEDYQKDPLPVTTDNKNNVIGRVDSWVHEDADSRKEQRRQGFYTEINDAAEQRIDEEDAPQGPKCQHALAIIGHPKHLQLVDKALELLSYNYHVYILFYNDPIEIESLSREKYSKSSPVSLLSLQSIPLNSKAEGIKNLFKDILWSVESIEDPNSREFVNIHLARMLSSYKLSMALDSLLDLTQAKAVLGCFDSNRFGVILSELKRSHDFKLINFQHGLKPLNYSSDFLKFDAYCVWDHQTGQLILKEGAQSNIFVTGNPEIEILKFKIENEPTSDEYGKLIEWKGDSALIVAYPQPLKGYVTRRTKEEFLRVQLEYIRDNKSLKLLIKEHPSEDDSLSAELVSQYGLNDRVLIRENNDLSYWESLKAADVVTSIYSTVLLEAACINIPAVALDFDNSIESQHLYPLREAVTVINEAESFAPIMNAILSAGRVKDSAALHNQYKPENYTEKISDMLRDCLKSAHDER